MPYAKISELPESVRDKVPLHAQEIYLAAFNSAWDLYDQPGACRGCASREETAEKVAWAAVRQRYKKGYDGVWYQKH